MLASPVWRHVPWIMTPSVDLTGRPIPMNVRWRCRPACKLHWYSVIIKELLYNSFAIESTAHEQMCEQKLIKKNQGFHNTSFCENTLVFWDNIKCFIISPSSEDNFLSNPVFCNFFSIQIPYSHISLIFISLLVVSSANYEFVLLIEIDYKIDSVMITIISFSHD